MRIQRFLDEVMMPARLADAASGTRRKYQTVVSKFNEYLGHDAGLDELSADSINVFLAWLESEGMRPERLQVYRTVLRTIASDAHERGQPTGPMTATQRERRRQKLQRALRGPKAKIKRRIVRAAALFANGLTLEEIGERLGVTAHAIHNWRGRHRAFWDSAYNAAIKNTIEVVMRKADGNAKSVPDAGFFAQTNRAEVALQAAGESLVRPPDNSQSSRTLAEFTADLSVERSWGESNQKNYLCVVKRIEKWHGRTMYVTQFSRDWVNRFIMDMEASGLSAATVRGTRVHLLSLWRAACEAELCYEEPKRIRKVKLQMPAPEAWGCDDVIRMLDQAGKLTNEYRFKDGKISASEFWTVAVRVLWETGLRIGDARRLRKSDIRSGGIIVVVQHKTGREHVVRLSGGTLKAINAMNASDDAILPLKFSHEMLRREFKVRILDPLGLTGSLKKMRKSSATSVELQQFGAGARQLGHAPGSKIAAVHYLDPALIGANWPMPQSLDVE